MENIILQKTRYLKAVMLTMLVGLFAFGASAQISNVVAPDDAILHYVGKDSVLTYDATQQGTESSMYLFRSFNYDQENLLGEGTFGTGQTINFTWPSVPDNYDLVLIEAEGDLNNPTEQIASNNINVLGSNSTSYSYFFNRSGGRQLTSNPTDFTGETVRLSVEIDVVNASLNDSLLVQYSTNGTTYTDLVAVTSEEKLGSDGTYEFDLPAGAISATTRFRIRQENSGSIGQDIDTWYVDNLELEFGDPFTFVDGVYIGEYTVSLFTIDVISIVDDQDNPINNGDFIYPRDTITLTAPALGFDFSDYNYVAYAENTVNGETYILSNQVVNTNTPDTISIEGSIPLNIPYNENWDFYIKAYDQNDSDALIGANYAELQGGYEFFEDEGERAYTTQGYDINSSEGTLTFSLAPIEGIGANVYPQGTEIEIQYSTDSVNFNTLAEVNLNELSYYSANFFTLDEWPNEVVSNSTYFRFKQKNNNGENLNSWAVGLINIDVNSNIINGSLFDYNPFTNVNISEPNIQLDVYNILANGEVFPGNTINLNYTITDGAFPAGTTIEGRLERNDLDYDIILGNSTTLNGTLGASIPAVIQDTYTVYLLANDVVSNDISLPVSGIQIQIDSLVANPSVSFFGNDAVYPGGEITSYYTITGSPGTGVDLLLKVEDNESGEYVTIGTTSTFGGSIAANLPDSIDYTGNYQLVLSDGSSILGNLMTLAQTNGFMPDIFNNIVGNDFGDNNYWNQGSERSATTVPYDIQDGAEVYIEYLTFGFSWNGNPYNIELQASIDGGEEWTTFDETFINDGDQSFSNGFVTVPVEFLSDSTQFRFITNENGNFPFDVNTFALTAFEIQVPERSELALANGFFNILRPTLKVETIETNLIVGDEITIDFNITGPFPTNTWVAAVIENAGSGEYELIGESEAVEIGSITGTLPVMPETMTGNAYDQIKLVPYIKATAETQYEQGSNIQVNSEEDFLVIEGDDNPQYANFLFFDGIGSRSALTRAFDLSAPSTAFIQFQFYDWTGSFDMDGNQTIVPRLQVSIDGGASFQEIPINNMNEQVGLLYDDQFYTVEVPEEYLTAATHFRWVQPLNLGESNQSWRIQNIQVVLGDINALQTFYTTRNDVQAVNLNIPSLATYEWMQSDINDAVFNGESFNYSWNFDPEADTTLYEDFPAGTTFDFYLRDANTGDYVIDPLTDNPFIIASTTTLGTAEAQVPFFARNGNYLVELAASIDVDGETYYYVGDETGGNFVGSLEVFLRVARLTYQGDENATIYAGQDVTFGIEFENNETNTASVEELYANLILNTNEGNLVLATQQGTADITVALPTDVTGFRNFSLEITENAPIAEVGSILENSDYSNLELNSSNFIAGDVRAIEVTSDLFFESQIIYTSAVVWASIDYDRQGAQNVVFEYSINGGAYQTQASFSGSANNFGYFLPNVMLDNSGNDNIRYRFRLSNNETDGSSFEVTRLEIDPDYFSGSYIPLNFTETGGKAEFANNSGRRLITTRDFAPEEIAEATLLTFEASFDQLPANLTASQYVNFEFSTDGGATYTALESYPEQDAMMTLSNESFTYAVTAAMKENGVRFRWRQEEAKGNFSVDNINMVFGEVLPFDYINTSQTISPQALIIDAVSAAEGCLDADVTLDYTIRGRFGTDNILTVDYANVNDLMNSTEIEGYEFNVSEGSGQVTFAFAGNTLGLTDDNGNYKFRLSANDETTNNVVNLDGSYSESSYELVAPINTDATFTVLNDPLSCSPEDVMVSINAANMQDYFLYEIIDGEGTVLGSLLRDPEDPQNEINIGQISTSTNLELRITSQSSTESVCNTLVVDEESVEVLQNFSLYSNINVDPNWKVVNTGTTLNSCENAGEISLSVRRLLESGSTTTAGTALVEWFRDNLNNQVAIGTNQISDFDMELSGEYFARVTTGSCVYTTERVQINLAGIPDQPTITVVSGDLAACSTADPVVLEAPEGFAYYRWTGNSAALFGNTRSITVDEPNSYRVEVSNVPFGTGCASVASAAVDVNRYDVPDFSVEYDNEEIGVGEILNACEATATIDFVNVGNNYVVQVIKDGANYASIETNTFDITESGVYSFVWNFNSLNVDGCTASSVEFTVNLNDVADVTPTITATGDLNSCDPENEVTLEGPAGFANYVWNRDNVLLDMNSRTITVSQTGSYTLAVSNVDLSLTCGLSNASSPVVLNAAPDPESYDLSVNGNVEQEGSEVELCSDFENTITIGGLTNTETVKWFRDGAEITPSFASNNNVLVTESGVYNAEVKVGQCVVATYAVTLTVVETPDAPALTADGALSFCEGEGTVTLTAPAGFDYYTWTRVDNFVTTVLNTPTNGFAQSNQIEVSTSGSYTVEVSNSANGCQSDASNPIVVNMVTEPNLPFLNQVNTTCGDGTVEFSITNGNNGNSAMTYQLYNGETGQPSGNPVTIQGGQTGSIFTDVLTEDGIPFYVEVSYADGTGCSYADPSQTEDADVRTITLEIEGASLIASYSTSGSQTRWYRNDVLLTNATGRSITITDAAEYTIEVEYNDGCLLTASSADIDGRVLSSRDAMDMQVTSYPNPAQSDITLNVNSQYMGKHEVLVTSMTGQVMMQSSFEKSSFGAEHAMDIANLQEGIYNVQIRHDGLTQNVRIIKK